MEFCTLCVGPGLWVGEFILLPVLLGTGEPETGSGYPRFGYATLLRRLGLTDLPPDRYPRGPMGPLPLTGPLAHEWSTNRT